VTGSPVEPPYDTLPPDAPATVEDVRVSRRWTWVALAWAVAASIIGVIALVHSNNKSNDNTQTTTTSGQDVAQQLAQFEKQVNDRLDAFSRRLSDTASSADLQKIDKRLTQTESDVSKVQNTLSTQGDTIKQMQSDIKDLQQRVSNLENQQQSGGGGNGGGTGTGTGTNTTP
jgi:septal ring factor EnvC (AmiA/AmiB activator)